MTESTVISRWVATGMGGIFDYSTSTNFLYIETAPLLSSSHILFRYVDIAGRRRVLFSGFASGSLLPRVDGVHYDHMKNLSVVLDNYTKLKTQPQPKPKHYGSNSRPYKINFLLRKEVGDNCEWFTDDEMEDNYKIFCKLGIYSKRYIHLPSEGKDGFTIGCYSNLDKAVHAKMKLGGRLLDTEDYVTPIFT